MDFRKLSYFEAVCRLGNFTKASKELHVSQPSVTMAIQSLEEHLNVQLIKRDKDGLLLTQEGEVLYKKAQHILNELEEVKNEIKLLAIKKNTTLQIGYSVQMRSAILNIVSDFKKVKSNIKVIANESPTPSIIKQVKEGKIDLGIIVLTKDANELYNTHSLFNGEVKVCINKNNPLSKKESITLEEFEKETLISLSLNNPKDSFIFKVMKDSYENKKISINPQFSSLQLESYFEHISNNDGIGVTFHDIWFNSSQYNIDFNGKLPYVEVSFYPRCTYTVGIISRKDKKLNKDSKEFIEFVKKQVK